MSEIDEWQEWILSLLALRPAREVFVTVPRQSGKTAALAYFEWGDGGPA